MTTSSQQEYPRRASWRTAAQTVISVVLVLGIVAPLVAAILSDELGGYLPDAWLAWVVGAAAVLAAVAAALARIMAIPAVDAWLRHLGLSSTPTLTVPDAGGVHDITTLAAAPRRKGDHVTTDSGSVSGVIFYAEQREDGWHYGVRLDGSDTVAMYREADLA
ncbi:hypothetical protein [Cellulosimicrobium sp. 22601]|uniref:hypothetical protein n=1 Tax=unclassified Cellulosimicrobium TaxID=2624466 RepID=UPI003F83E69B